MRPKPPAPAPSQPFHNAFASLRALRKPAGSAETAPDPEPVTEAPTAPPGKAIVAARAVVRMERAGRGGKEVTVIDHLGAVDLADWLQRLKSALGCGGTLDGHLIVLQGDHRKRLATLLPTYGVRKVTIG